MSGVVALALVVALVFAVGAGSPAKTSGTTTTSAPTETATPGQASTSDAGVTGTSIRVVFPVSNLSSLASSFGFAGDIEYSEQDKAIRLFVKLINDSGGIHGRKIDADIVNFDPTSETGMRALCKQWTEGSDPAFAVLDGIGTWTGDSQLCITQEGHTPLLSQWTTVTNWTEQGAPYLWWTGPDDAAILAGHRAFARQHREARHAGIDRRALRRRLAVRGRPFGDRGINVGNAHQQPPWPHPAASRRIRPGPGRARCRCQSRTRGVSAGRGLPKPLFSWVRPGFSSCTSRRTSAGKSGRNPASSIAWCARALRSIGAFVMRPS